MIRKIGNLITKHEVPAEMHQGHFSTVDAIQNAYVLLRTFNNANGNTYVTNRVIGHLDRAMDPNQARSILSAQRIDAPNLEHLLHAVHSLRALPNRTNLE